MSFTETARKMRLASFNVSCLSFKRSSCMIPSLKCILPAIAAASLHISAHAALVDLGNGAIYDTTRNITWTQDVRYDETDLQPNSRMYGLDGAIITNNDGSTHTVTSADIYQVVPAGAFRVGGTWWGATAWANTLTYGGVSGWRLPTDSELVGILNENINQYPAGAGVFSNAVYSLYPYLFWSSTETDANTVVQVESMPFGNPAYYQYPVPKQLDQSGSFIQVAWAVHDGNILAVPEPNALVLFGVGLITIFGLKRSRLLQSNG
jgi:hypothetical protein